MNNHTAMLGLDLTVYDPHYQYDPNVPGEDDPLAIPLMDRKGYEQACRAFHVRPKSDEELLNTHGAWSGADPTPEEWSDMGRDGRVSWRLDSRYYFTLKRIQDAVGWAEDLRAFTEATKNVF